MLAALLDEPERLTFGPVTLPFANVLQGCPRAR
jgi:hypothetical protein